MKLIAITALLLPMSASAEAPPAPAKAPAAVERAQMPNAFRDSPAGCLPIVQQVAGEDKEHRGTRLDQQPPAKLLFAVGRNVDGCNEVTFVHARDRAAAGRR